MKFLSTLAFLAVALQCINASTERKLLRSEASVPVDFSTLTDSKTLAGDMPTNSLGGDVTKNMPLADVDSLTSGHGAPMDMLLAGMGSGAALPSGDLPNTNNLKSPTTVEEMPIRRLVGGSDDANDGNDNTSVSEAGFVGKNGGGLPPTSSDGRSFPATV
ncbi:hypothetical protein BBJ28_00002003 [Nothophytophthora sp. Chile5]|nr:hypothetical protein BBJ28_00002003 [Nothophytophthora sp. Chile5]